MKKGVTRAGLARRSRREALFATAKVGITALGLAKLRGGLMSEALGASSVTALGGKALWATGGTAVMTRIYSDPFVLDSSQTCTMTCAQILGPCYAPTQMRSDVSEGHAGIPMRLSLRIVNEACLPIQGASVDIWHVAPEGVYSGQVQNAMCNEDDEAARRADFFRGVQTSDADGRVDFDSCFPGWYPGRSVHIHFTIRIGDVESVTSQLYFDDSLVDDIMANYGDYSRRGPRDTTNATDMVISGDEVANYILSTARMPDGAMQAWKTLVVRSSDDEDLCQVKGAPMPKPHPVL